MRVVHLRDMYDQTGFDRVILQETKSLIWVVCTSECWSEYLLCGKGEDSMPPNSFSLGWGTQTSFSLSTLGLFGIIWRDDEGTETLRWGFSDSQGQNLKPFGMKLNRQGYKVICRGSFLALVGSDRVAVYEPRRDGILKSVSLSWLKDRKFLDLHDGLLYVQEGNKILRGAKRCWTNVVTTDELPSTHYEGKVTVLEDRIVLSYYPSDRNLPTRHYVVSDSDITEFSTSHLTEVQVCGSTLFLCQEGYVEQIGGDLVIELPEDYLDVLVLNDCSGVVCMSSRSVFYLNLEESLANWRDITEELVPCLEDETCLNYLWPGVGPRSFFFSCGKHSSPCEHIYWVEM